MTSVTRECLGLAPLQKDADIKNVLEYTSARVVCLEQCVCPSNGANSSPFVFVDKTGGACLEIREN